MRQGLAIALETSAGPTALGLELGAGVSVATMAAVTPG